MPALVVNTNISSLNGQRNLYKSTGALSKALERLSSGLRINRAGDDAAGLAISEGLRSQVRGLNQAVRNANDGISLINTAEGALDTYTQILQRVRELAIQASSDVNSDTNRASIQLEIDQQIDELNRIANTINFNGAMLFDGTFVNKRIQVGADVGQYMDISVGDIRTNTIGAVAGVEGVAVNQVAMSNGDVLINGYQVPASASGSAIDKAAAIQSIFADTGVSAQVLATEVTGGANVGGGVLDGTNNFTINGVQFGSATETITCLADDSDNTLRAAINAKSNVTGVTATIEAGKLVLTAADGRDIVVSENGTGDVISGFSAGTTGGRIDLISDQAFAVSDGGGSSAALIGANGTFAVDYNTAVNRISVRTLDEAQDTITSVAHALRQINDVRSKLGAITNRLENTVSNLQVVSENLAASDSRIRDADFAAETANLTRAQILQQSGVAVLAQANLTPQAALSLLQG
ncbi:flagellin [bacterium]|nr:flagellin [bacterium]